MLDYIQERIRYLRGMYKQTGHTKYQHRYKELENLLKKMKEKKDDVQRTGG